MTKNGILIAAVVILMCACVAIGLIGYYSVGFTDWTKFGGEAPPAEPATPDELEVPEEPVKYYSNIEVGDILGTVYFNKDFDIKSFLAESIGENQSDHNYLRIAGGSATGNNWQIIVAYLFDESLADFAVSHLPGITFPQHFRLPFLQAEAAAVLLRLPGLNRPERTKCARASGKFRQHLPRQVHRLRKKPAGSPIR